MMSMATMSMSMTMSTILRADLSGNLVSNWVALLSWNLDTDWSGNLSLMLLRHLVALSLNMLLTLWSSAVTRWISGSLAIVTSIGAMADHLGIMTNNSGAVVDLGLGLCALSGEGLLTLLDVGGVNNSLAHWSGNLSGVLLWNLVALLLNMLLALRS